MTLLSIRQINFEELCLSTNMDEAIVLELVEYKIVEPAAGHHRDEWLFDVRAASRVNRALRLHRELMLDMADLALVLKLLDDNEQLQEENARLRQRLKRFEINDTNQ